MLMKLDGASRAVTVAGKQVLTELILRAKGQGILNYFLIKKHE